VTDNFALNYSMSPVNSAAQFSTVIDSSRRSAVAARSWQNYLANSGKFGTITLIPSVAVVGRTFVQPVPGNVRQLFTHESAPLREIVKVMMCFSNNFISERLGDTVGGPYRVAQISQQAAGVSPAEFILQTSSGLGVNRVTPRAMMKLMRALRFELARHKMTFADVMPVAGIDKGTLAGRFASDFAPGNVVGKTGTLGNTDAGVSALSGEMHTRQGTFLFVIFNQRGSVPRFRAFQNSYIVNLQNQLGGAAPSPYNPISLDVRLANTRITYPEMRARIN
jgi:D-alanyl-D-alanine carboxypeptidase/D-alanyl-D-alanine-endopeptidase (penicillin-binding protein 4)